MTGLAGGSGRVKIWHIWVISMGNVHKCIILTFPDPPANPVIFDGPSKVSFSTIWAVLGQQGKYPPIPHNRGVANSVKKNDQVGRGGQGRSKYGPECTLCNKENGLNLALEPSRDP